MNSMQKEKASSFVLFPAFAFYFTQPDAFVRGFHLLTDFRDSFYHLLFPVIDNVCSIKILLLIAIFQISEHIDMHQQRTKLCTVKLL